MFLQVQRPRRRSFLPVIALPLLLLCASCLKERTAEAAIDFSVAPAETAVARGSQAAQDQILKYKCSAADASARQKARRIVAALDNRQLAAQVIISGIDGKGYLPPHMRILLADSPAGGVMLFKYNLDTDSAAIQDLIAETQAVIAFEHGIPPFVAIDHEGGTVNRFRRGFADLPPAASYHELAHTDRDAALAQIYTDSVNAGKAINTLGINVNLAPVAEYLNNDNSDFLEDRSYGPDPGFAAEAAAAFIAGMEQAGILCVAKHFPGSAGPDPHHFPSVLNGDKAALAELVSPVAALIRGDRARAIMVSHSAVPAWDNVIASLSPVVMGAWLRQELGFDGIVICDDFSMASAGGPASAEDELAENQSRLTPETAAVLSLAAGADMVLVWPPDLRRTHQAIWAALDDGRLPRERLRDAAERIIFEKARTGLIR